MSCPVLRACVVQPGLIDRALARVVVRLASAAFSSVCGPRSGVAMVFAGIGYEMRGKYQRHHAKKNIKA